MSARRPAGAHSRTIGLLTLQVGSSCAPTNSLRYDRVPDTFVQQDIRIVPDYVLKRILGFMTWPHSQVLSAL